MCWRNKNISELVVVPRTSNKHVNHGFFFSRTKHQYSEIKLFNAKSVVLKLWYVYTTGVTEASPGGSPNGCRESKQLKFIELMLLLIFTNKILLKFTKK